MASSSPGLALAQSDHISWDSELKHRLWRNQRAIYAEENVRIGQYRPFIKEFLYADFAFGQRKYQQDKIFPGISANIRVSLSGAAEQRSSGAAEQRSSGAAEQRSSGAAEQRSSGAAEQRSSGAAEQRSSGAAEQRSSGAAEQRSSGAAEQRSSGARPNLAICVPGVGSTKPFCALVVDRLPDLEVVAKGQCFPRYRYQRRIALSASPESVPTSRSRSSSPTPCPTSTSSSSGSASPDGSIPDQGGIFDDAELFTTELERVDNITDTALRAFQQHYDDDEITKDFIFEYVYGVLHAPAYRERFATDLSKALPRIPLASDFGAFAQAGRSLMKLHLGYESGPEYPLKVLLPKGESLSPGHCQIGDKRMRWLAGKSELKVNDKLRLGRIPAEAHKYVVNGRTPLEWFIDRYRVTKDSHSGIVNDPNGWFEENPLELIAAFKRIVHLSVETVRIVASLPTPFAEPIEE